MKSHLFELCRAAYQCAREHGSPPIVSCNLGNGLFVIESKDGKVRKDSCNIPYTHCCVWAAKLDVAEEWIKKFSEPVPKPQS